MAAPPTQLSAEEQERLEQGLRILARLIARAHAKALAQSDEKAPFEQSSRRKQQKQAQA